MKSVKTKAMALAICLVLLGAIIPISAALLLYPTSAPKTPLVGEVFTGRYLKIGIEDQYGDFGITYPESVGFQYPIGEEYESLAVGRWGEGYVIAYDDNVYYHQPCYGISGGMIPVGSYVISDTPTEVRYLVVAQAGDIRTYFYFIFPKATRNVYLYTILHNTGDTNLSKVYYKRLIDWDVCQPTLGTFDNSWTWLPSANAAIAFASVPGVGTVYNYVMGYPAPDEYDLNAWDDDTIVGVGSSHVKSDYPSVITDYDGFAGLHWYLGSLAPGEYKVILTVYGAFSSSSSTGMVEELRDESEMIQDAYNEKEAIQRLLMFQKIRENIKDMRKS